jgi:hypothetical protein
MFGESENFSSSQTHICCHPTKLTCIQRTSASGGLNKCPLGPLSKERLTDISYLSVGYFFHTIFAVLLFPMKNNSITVKVTLD